MGLGDLKRGGGEGGHDLHGLQGAIAGRDVGCQGVAARHSQVSRTERCPQSAHVCHRQGTAQHTPHDDLSLVHRILTF